MCILAVLDGCPGAVAVAHPVWVELVHLTHPTGLWEITSLASIGATVLPVLGQLARASL